MNVGLEQILTWGGMVAGLFGVWFRMQYKLERLDEKHSEQARQIDAFWKWKDLHEKDSIRWREEFNKETARLAGANLVFNERLSQIMSILEEIKIEIKKR